MTFYKWHILNQNAMEANGLHVEWDRYIILVFQELNILSLYVKLGVCNDNSGGFMANMAQKLNLIDGI